MRTWGLDLGGTDCLWAHRIQESPESPAPQLSMLRVKSEDGEQAFLLLMRPEDTVGDVRDLLAQARWVWARLAAASGIWSQDPA